MSHTSTAPTSSALAAAELDRLANRCRLALDSLRGEIDEDFGQPPPPDPAASTALLFDTQAVPPHQILLVIGEAASYHCTVTGSGTLPTIESDGNVSALPVAPPPDTGHVQVAGQSWDTGVRADTGPGSVYVVGRVGPDVTSIELELPDGSIIDGEIQDGWFLIEGPIPDGVAAFEERLNWTTATGQQLSERADLLDPPTQVEACAELPDCVVTSLDVLRGEAEMYGLDAQAAILADLDVTTDELRAAREAFADCVNALPYDITVRIDDEVVSIGGSDLDSASPEWDEVNDAQNACSATHLDLVSEASALLDAQRRVNESRT
jgi:hypothetical protein